MRNHGSLSFTAKLLDQVALLLILGCNIFAGRFYISTRQSELARKNLDRTLEPLRNGPVAPPRRWTKAIREALGMTTRQLAGRLGVAPSRVTAIEKAEAAGGITLRTLRDTAAALDCQLIYAFVPIKPLGQIRYD